MWWPVDTPDINTLETSGVFLSSIFGHIENRFVPQLLAAIRNQTIPILREIHSMKIAAATRNYDVAITYKAVRMVI